MSANIADEDEAQSGAVQMVKLASNAFLNESFEQQPEFLTVSNTAKDLYGGKIVMVSHGMPAFLCGGRARVSYCSIVDLAMFEDCQLVAIACYSAQILGREAVKYAFCYFGFDSTLGIPTSECPSFHEYVRLIGKLLSYFHNLPAGSLAHADVVGFLAEFRDEIERTKTGHQNADGSNLPAFDLICLKNLQNDLCVWMRGMNDPIKCEGAPSISLLWG